MTSVLFEALRMRLLAIADRRAPDVVIGGEADPYLRRWWVIPRNRRLNIYLHHFCRSDDDRALHDHPWGNASLLLRGSYREIVPVDPANPAGETQTLLREEGAFVLRRSGEMAHRIDLLRTNGVEQPVWTLFITGPNVRSWGFWCPKGWVHWREFTNPADGGATVGRGCGEPS
ncbi:hypothetical protein ACQVP2_07540 [Methylobacterium aquaticum]|uniref:hypothetical protein n=1 Tax=Methylobacterium aquaticum TaxID=270351 RepID=UPI003D16D10A